MDDMDLVFKRLGDNLDLVESLNLTNRGLKQLPPFLTDLKQLKYLYLDYNKLIFVPEIGSLVQLEEMSIENNELSLIPETFNNLTRLKLLNLSKNNIKCLNNSLFTCVTNLTTLWMNNCDLMYLPREIGCLKSLEKLGLKSNALESLPDEIGSLSKLQWLNLEKNEIRELPCEFKHLKLLNYLNMNKNKLEKIPDEVFHLTSLNILLITDNLIKRIKDDEIMGLSTLQKVDFKDNPFLQTMPPELYQQLYSINNFILNND